MARFTRPTSLVFIALALAAPIASLADSLAKANAGDIPKLLDAASGRNSAYSALLVGETRDRVYFEYITGIHASSFFTNKPNRIVYWLPRADVTDAQMARFRVYRDKMMEAHRGISTQGD